MFSIKDFNIAFHSLLKAKGYVITVVLTLGITLGALVAMFNLNYQLLASPLPYPDQDRLYIVKGSAYKNGQLAFSDLNSYPALIEAYTDKENYFYQKALINVDQDIIRSLPDTPQINTSFITPEYLDLLH
ncbi:MAG: ABC transporter permease, partial [Flavobacterium sp.]